MDLKYVIKSYLNLNRIQIRLSNLGSPGYISDFMIKCTLGHSGRVTHTL